MKITLFCHPRLCQYWSLHGHNSSNNARVQQYLSLYLPETATLPSRQLNMHVDCSDCSKLVQPVSAMPYSPSACSLSSSSSLLAFLCCHLEIGIRAQIVRACLSCKHIVLGDLTQYTYQSGLGKHNCPERPECAPEDSRLPCGSCGSCGLCWSREPVFVYLACGFNVAFGTSCVSWNLLVLALTFVPTSQPCLLDCRISQAASFFTIFASGSVAQWSSGYCQLPTLPTKT